MRFHPAVYQNYRLAAHDDVLPLSKPINTTDGKVITKLPIPKGMKIILSIAAYNRSLNSFNHFYTIDDHRLHTGTRKYLERTRTFSILKGGSETPERKEVRR